MAASQRVDQVMTLPTPAATSFMTRNSEPMSTAKWNDGGSIDCSMDYNREAESERLQILWPCSSVKANATMLESEKGSNAACKPSDGLDLSEFKHQFEDIEQKLDILTLQMSSCLDCVGAIARATQEWEHHQAAVANQLSTVASLQSQRNRCVRRQMKNPTTTSALSSAPAVSYECSEATGTPMVSSRWRIDSPMSTQLPPVPFPPGTGEGTVTRNSLTRRASMEQNVLDTLEALAVTHSRPAVATAAWNFLEDPDSSRSARWFSRVWPVFIAISAVASLAESYDLPTKYHVPLGMFNGFAEAMFLIEVTIRYLVFPTTFLFLKSFSCIVDVFAAVTLVVRLPAQFTVPEEGIDTLSDTGRYLLLCFVPMARMLKLLRSFQYSKLMKVVMESVTDALKFLIYIMILILLLYSAIFFIVEPRSSVESLPAAIWYSVMTMTTVGFLTPESPGGYAASGSLMILSVMYMSMPLGVLGNAFTQVWLDRDRILLIGTFRARLDQYGYTALDMKTLFHYYNHSGDGELNMEEFRKMIAEMQVGISDEQILSLYECIDRDGGGTIDDKEFVKALFPESFHDVFQAGKKKKGNKSSRRIRAREKTEPGAELANSEQSSPQ